MQDRIGLVDDVLERCVADGVIVVHGHLAQVHVHAEQVPAFAGDVQDRTVHGLDRALGADIREVRIRQDVHHAPGMVGGVAGQLAADR